MLPTPLPRRQLLRVMWMMQPLWWQQRAVGRQLGLETWMPREPERSRSTRRKTHLPKRAKSFEMDQGNFRNAQLPYTQTKSVAVPLAIVPSVVKLVCAKVFICAITLTLVGNHDE